MHQTSPKCIQMCPGFDSKRSGKRSSVLKTHENKLFGFDVRWESFVWIRWSGQGAASELLFFENGKGAGGTPSEPESINGINGPVFPCHPMSSSKANSLLEKHAWNCNALVMLLSGLVICGAMDAYGCLWGKKLCHALSIFGQRSQLCSSSNGYGSMSIPIDPFLVFFSGMNIHLPAILMFTRGTRVLTHPQITIRLLLFAALLLAAGEPKTFLRRSSSDNGSGEKASSSPVFSRLKSKAESTRMATDTLYIQMLIFGIYHIIPYLLARLAIPVVWHWLLCDKIVAWTWGLFLTQTGRKTPLMSLARHLDHGWQNAL